MNEKVLIAFFPRNKRVVKLVLYDFQEQKKSPRFSLAFYERTFLLQCRYLSDCLSFFSITQHKSSFHTGRNLLRYRGFFRKVIISNSTSVSPFLWSFFHVSEDLLQFVQVDFTT